MDYFFSKSTHSLPSYSTRLGGPGLQPRSPENILDPAAIGRWRSCGASTPCPHLARSGNADAPGIGAPDPRFGGSAGTPPLVERVSLCGNAFLVRLSHGNTEREGCRPHEPRLAAG